MKTTMFVLFFALICSSGYGATAPIVENFAAGEGSTNLVIINGQIVSGGQGGEMIQGSGVVATETRDLADFRELVLNIGAEVRVAPAKKTALSITADDNLLAVISTEVAAGILTISATRSLSTANPIRIDIRTPAVSGATVNGSGSLHLDRVSEEALSLVVSGSGDISAEGTADRLSIIVNGSGDLHLKELRAKSCDILINGSGGAELSVRNLLDARINGSGDVMLFENPDQVNSRIDGSGQILRAR